MANGIPQFPEDRAEEETQLGARMLRRQTESSPRFSFPDISGRPSVRNTLLNALLGAQQGIPAALDAARLGEPTAAFLAGAVGGGAGAAQRPAEQLEQQMAKRQAELELAQFELQPIESVSKPLADKFGLHGMPLGLVNKIAPVLQRSEEMEKRMAFMELSQNLQEGRFNAKENNDRIAELERSLSDVRGVVTQSTNPQLFQEMTLELAMRRAAKKPGKSAAAAPATTPAAATTALTPEILAQAQAIKADNSLSPQQKVQKLKGLGFGD